MRKYLYERSSTAGILIIGLVLFLMSFILGVACYAPASTPSPTLTPAPTATLEATGLEIKVTARYASFQPSTITVVKEQTVKLTLISTDVPHTFTIDELGINVAVGAGQTVTEEFTVGKAGTFTFYCAVGQHRVAGMEGTLKATE